MATEALWYVALHEKSVRNAWRIVINRNHHWQTIEKNPNNNTTIRVTEQWKIKTKKCNEWEVSLKI